MVRICALLKFERSQRRKTGVLQPRKIHRSSRLAKESFACNYELTNFRFRRSKKSHLSAPLPSNTMIFTASTFLPFDFLAYSRLHLPSLSPVSLLASRYHILHTPIFTLHQMCLFTRCLQFLLIPVEALAAEVTPFVRVRVTGRHR